MGTIKRSIDVELPVRTVYDQWTQFEEFPQFMEGVRLVHQVDDRRLHFVAEIGGQQRAWEAEITEQHPDERVAWRSTSGVPNASVVTFHRLAADKTRVMLQLEYEPHGVLEHSGDTLGIAARRVTGDLERFREYLRDRGPETGGWRGEIPHPDTLLPRPPATGRSDGPAEPIDDLEWRAEPPLAALPDDLWSLDG